jgi:arginase
MRIDLLTVPYDSGRRAERMGAGPLRFLELGLDGRLARSGHDVRPIAIERPPGLWSEAASAFELNRRIAGAVATSRQSGRFPLVLSGNCNSAIGVLAGLGEPRHTAIAWFDGHGDFNTPETTSSGFFDGMALSIATGDAWRALASSIDGFETVPPEHILLLGARDIDPAERERIDRMRVAWLPPARMHALTEVVARLRGTTAQLLLHVDVDVLDPSEAPTNHFGPADGLTARVLFDSVRTLGAAIPIRGAVIASWDPSLDRDNRLFDIACELIDTVLSIAPAS